MSPAVTAERVKNAIQQRISPIRQLTPEFLVRALEGFARGDLRQAVLLWEAIEERDDLLPTVREKRFSAAALLDWECVPDAESGDAGDAHAEKLTAFYRGLTATSALDRNERGGVALLVRQMLDSVGKRYAVHEIVWRPGAAPTAEFIFTPLTFFENRTGRLRFLEQEHALEGRELEPDGWMVTCGAGLMRFCALLYLFKKYPLNDWLNYCEVAGNPGVIWKTIAARGSAEWNGIADILANLGVDPNLLVSRDEEVEQFNRTLASLPYPELIARCDRLIATAWRGGDLSTISADAKGTPLQQTEGASLEDADAKTVSETLHEHVDRRVIGIHFGEGVEPLARFCLKPKARFDVQAEITKWEAAAGLGVPLLVRDFCERFSLPLPPDADEDQLLRAPAAPPAARPGDPVQDALAGGLAPQNYAPAANAEAAAALARGLREDFAPLAAALAAAAAEGAPLNPERARALVAQFPVLAAQVLAEDAAGTELEQLLERAAQAGALAGAEHRAKEQK